MSKKRLWILLAVILIILIGMLYFAEHLFSKKLYTLAVVMVSVIVFALKPICESVVALLLPETQRWKPERYHELVKNLAGEGKDDLKLDCQTAIIFELRYFSQYHDHTVRMLKRWAERRAAARKSQNADVFESESEEKSRADALKSEIKDTLCYIKKHQR